MSLPLRSIDLQALCYLAEYRVLSVKQLAVLENANIRSVRRRLAVLDQQGFTNKIARIRGYSNHKHAHGFS